MRACEPESGSLDAESGLIVTMAAGSPPPPAGRRHLERALEEVASGTDAERLAALEELYRALEAELEDNGGQALPTRR